MAPKKKNPDRPPFGARPSKGNPPGRNATRVMRAGALGDQHLQARGRRCEPGRNNGADLRLQARRALRRIAARAPHTPDPGPRRVVRRTGARRLQSSCQAALSRQRGIDAARGQALRPRRRPRLEHAGAATWTRQRHLPARRQTRFRADRGVRGGLPCRYAPARALPGRGHPATNRALDEGPRHASLGEPCDGSWRCRVAAVRRARTSIGGKS